MTPCDPSTRPTTFVPYLRKNVETDSGERKARETPSSLGDRIDQTGPVLLFYKSDLGILQQIRAGIASSFLEAGRRIDWNNGIGTRLALISVRTDDNSRFSILALQYYWLLSHSPQRRGSAQGGLNRSRDRS
jgi:hypothetical protein